MPEELAAVLADDPEGDKIFHALTAGKLRTMLYVISQGIDSDDRIWRAVQVIEHIKKRAGKIDFKALYQDLRK